MLKKKNTNKFFLVLFLGIFLFGVISAEGLSIEQTDISASKQYQNDTTFTINVFNQESFTFTNITFKEDIVFLPKFNLAPGENKSVEVTIVSDEFYSGDLTLQGEYEILIGASNKTEEIRVDFDSGFDRCNIEIIKGDSITWINEALDRINLVNADTKVDFATIEDDSQYTEKFNNPMLLNYYASIMGYSFTYECSINVLDDQGFVHSIKYDDTINLDLEIKYDPTEISLDFLTTSYTMDYNDVQEAMFQITNIGSKLAKNIRFSGDWLKDFSRNEFDLEIGESVTISYKIDPEVINTNQTNVTNKKELLVEGNFNDAIQNISIFINYEEIDSSMFDGDVDSEVLENFFKYWCKDKDDGCIELFCSVNPEFCENGQITGSNNKNHSLSEDSLKKFIQGQIEAQREQDIMQKAQIEQDINQTSQIVQIDSTSKVTEEKVEVLGEKVSNLGIAIYLFMGAFMVGAIIFMVMKMRNNITSNGGFRKKFGFHKGER